MKIENYIDHSLPELYAGDTVAKAMELMEDYRVKQYAVLDEENYKGLISEGLLSHIDNQDAVLGELALEHPDVFVHSSDHFFEVLKKYEQHKIMIVPVLNDKGEFDGVINLADSVEAFSKIASSQFEGAIITMAINERQYSLADICKIVESNNLKVLCSYVAKNAKVEGVLDVTIKLNRNEISKVEAALERYGYDITEKYTHTDVLNEDKERLDMFLKYLNM